MINIKMTKYLQGIAILMMIFHHYILCSLDINNYSTLLQIVLSCFGWFGKLCVAIFLLCSGIGMYYKQLSIEENKLVNYCLKKDYILYQKYMLILVLSLPFLYFILDYRLEWETFILHIFTLKSSYNNAWWFLNTYLLLMISFPFFFWIHKRKSIFFITMFLMIIGYVFNTLNTYFQLGLFNNIIISSIYLFIVNQFSFCCGFLFAENYNKIKRLKIQPVIGILIIIFMIFFRGILHKNGIDNVFTDTILAIILIYILINNFIFYKFFVFFGKHSTNLWLVHMFFINFLKVYNLFNIPIILGLLFVIVMSLITDVCISKLELKIFNKRRYK